MKRRLFSFALILLMVISLLPAAAMSAEQEAVADVNTDGCLDLRDAAALYQLLQQIP